MRLLELFERSGGTVAVAFGRMNPPTIGHQKVVDAILKQKADAHFLFVSQTHKPTGKNKTRLENPLPFDIKLGFIQQAFPDIDIGDTSVSTAIGILQNLEKQGFENVIFVCGSDRVAAFTELFNNQNGVDYDLKSIKIVSSGARDPDAEGAEGMSASKMRAAAIANDIESFKSGLPAGLSGDAEEVFSAVRQGLEPWLEGVEEGWKDKVAAAGLAGAMAFGAGGAHARVSGDQDPGINRLTGKPIATQQATGNAPAKAEAPKGFSKEYLQAVVDGKHPRPMVSVEKAKELLKNMSESSKIPFAGAKVGHKEGPAGQWRNKGSKANKPAKAGDLVGETALRDKEDYHAKRKALDDLGRNKDVDQKAVQQRRLDLDKEAKQKGVAEGSDWNTAAGDLESIQEAPIEMDEDWRKKLAALGMAGMMGASGAAGAADRAPEAKTDPIVATIVIDGEVKKLDLTPKGFTDVRDAEKWIAKFMKDRGIMDWQGKIERGEPGTGRYQRLRIAGAGGLESIQEAPIEMDPADPMDPMIYGHDKANPGKLKYRMSRAAGQLKDLASRVDSATPEDWQRMARQFEELKMNMEQIRYALEELGKVRKKGGIRSRGITV